LKTLTSTYKNVSMPCLRLGHRVLSREGRKRLEKLDFVQTLSTKVKKHPLLTKEQSFVYVMKSSIRYRWRMWNVKLDING